MQIGESYISIFICIEGDNTIHDGMGLKGHHHSKPSVLPYRKK